MGNGHPPGAARWRLGGLLLAIGGLAGCSGAHEPVQVASNPTPPAAAPTTNVPALLGLSIDSLHRRLGPVQPLPGNLGSLANLFGRSTTGSAGQDSLASFRTGGLTLIASYSARTRQVSDLLVLGNREDSLVARAALHANASNYLLLPVFRPDQPGRLLGLRVISLQ